MRTLAIYAGSFDPPTLGHLSIISRSARLWDEVVVVVAINPSKKPWLVPEQRVEMLRDITVNFGNVHVETTSELIARFVARYTEHDQVVLVRGVRDGTDLDEEFWLAQANREIGVGLETVFLPATSCFKEISSTAVRELHRRGTSVAGLLHPRTAARLADESFGFEGNYDAQKY